MTSGLDLHAQHSSSEPHRSLGSHRQWHGQHSKPVSGASKPEPARTDVELDNCDNGPVTVAVTAQPGPGNLLGNLLSDVTHILDDNAATINNIALQNGQLVVAACSMVSPSQPRSP